MADNEKLMACPPRNLIDRELSRVLTCWERDKSHDEAFLAGWRAAAARTPPQAEGDVVLIQGLRTHAFDDCGGKELPTHICNIAADRLEALAARTPPQAIDEANYPLEAIKQLTEHQEQLDFDGVMVGVSRQALDETLAYLAALPDRREVEEMRELARIGKEHLQAGNIDDALTAFNRIGREKGSE